MLGKTMVLDFIFFHIKKKGKVTELGLLKASLLEIGDQIKNEDQKSTQTEKGDQYMQKSTNDFEKNCT
jgi:hypothetical protein